MKYLEQEACIVLDPFLLGLNKIANEGFIYSKGGAGQKLVRGISHFTPLKFFGLT